MSPRATVTPEFNVSPEHKTVLVEQLVPQIVSALDQLGGGQGSLADDFIDTLAMALGMLLANDTNLKTPRDLRDASLTVAKHVERHAKAYRAAEREGEPTAFIATLQGFDPARLQPN